MRISEKAVVTGSTPVFGAFDRDEVETRMGGGSVRCLARQNGSNARFFLHDEFDIYNNGRLFEALEQAIGYRNITIDLAHTTFIDASIIGVFVRLANRCRKNNAAHVHIVNASTHVRRLFSICKLEGFFGTAAR